MPKKRVFSMLKSDEQFDETQEEESSFERAGSVMEYGHEQAVADGVNVDFEIYKIRTKITEGCAKVLGRVAGSLLLLRQPNPR